MSDFMHLYRPQPDAHLCAVCESGDDDCSLAWPDGARDLLLHRIPVCQNCFDVIADRRVAASARCEAERAERIKALDALYEDGDA